MPPKAKLKREEVAAAVLALIRRGESVTARSVANELNCSPRPLFTVFSSMEEIEREGISAARAVYNGYIAEGLLDELPFKGTGKAYIRFAREEPALFRLLFMTASDGPARFETVPESADVNYSRILSAISSGYGLGREAADRLYKHLWIYTHGIAAMTAMGTVAFSEEETDRLLTEVFVPLLKAEKARQNGGI